MLNIINFVEKYILTFENFVAVFICALMLFYMKTDTDLQKLKNQAIYHGYAKYDEYKGNWRWITEEDLHKQ
jgi:hypothetical protein